MPSWMSAPATGEIQRKAAKPMATPESAIPTTMLCSAIARARLEITTASATRSWPMCNPERGRSARRWRQTATATPWYNGTFALRQSAISQVCAIPRVPWPSITSAMRPRKLSRRCAPRLTRCSGAYSNRSRSGGVNRSNVSWRPTSSTLDDRGAALAKCSTEID